MPALNVCPVLADVPFNYVVGGLAIVAVLVVLFSLLLILFEPAQQYRIELPSCSLDSDEFLRLVGSLSDAQIHRHSCIEVLTDGEAFYEAELAALRAARRSINLEAFIFQPGAITDRFMEVLTERAQAGVKVKITLDNIGTLWTPRRYFNGLRAAGGQVVWYHPLRWYNLRRMNNRTHRELIVVDGRVGFIGGAGVSDRWWRGAAGKPPWRDTMFRVEGDLVVGLQTAFTENWLQAGDEILAGHDYFPFEAGARREDGEVAGLVVLSAPSWAGRATRAGILFQALLAAARHSICVTSPYFVPDASACAEMGRAIRERGVRVRILTPGPLNNHPLARYVSRRLYGELLQAGAEIYEYQPRMIHTKALVIDGLWSVVGSTNFDNRSFGLNDEVNLAAVDAALAKRLLADFEADLAHSRRITLEEWRRRPWSEHVKEWLAWILTRQT
jgi:cardiolipin synthase